MSSAATDHHDHPKMMPADWPVDEDYGNITAGKLSMWFFLLTDAMSFAGLLLAYGLLRGGAETWVNPGEPILGIEFTAALTFLLICSSVTMVMAYANIVEKNTSRASLYLFLTIVGGSLFLCGQLQEYWGTFEAIFHHKGLIADGLIFGNSHYATTFYVITGFHGLHVLTGVIYITIIFVRTLLGKYDDGDYNHIEILGLFWHFVDLVWILVFTLVYLIPN